MRYHQGSRRIFREVLRVGVPMLTSVSTTGGFFLVGGVMLFFDRAM